MKKRHITIVLFILLSIVSYKYIALHDEGETTSPVELSSKIANQNEPAKDTSDNVFQESNLQVAKDESNDIQQEYKFTKLKLNEIEYLPSIMALILQVGGDIDRLNTHEKIALGKSLQFCGTTPKHNWDENEQRKNDIYFNLPLGTLSLHEKMCKDVPDELIYASYSILENEAKIGDLQASLLFYVAQTPELLKASMNNDYENIDIDKLKAEHNLKSNELLIDSVYNGSLQAATLIAVETMFGGGGFKKDNKASLGYFLAVNSILKASDLDKDIDNIKSNLNEQDIIEAAEFAQELIYQWQTLEGGIW